MAVLRSPRGGWPIAEAAPGLDADKTAKIAAWLDLVAAWNARVDLTAARSDRELVDLMLADATVLSERISVGARLVDVGTGAGAPGLALALLRPDLRVTLVEPMAKRASFLRTCLGTLDRVDVSLETKKGETLADEGAVFDAAVARATLPPPAWLELGRRLVRPGGEVWLLLARESAPGSPGLTRGPVLEYVWPLTGAQRRAVRYERRNGPGSAPA